MNHQAEPVDPGVVLEATRNQDKRHEAQLSGVFGHDFSQDPSQGEPQAAASLEEGRSFSFRAHAGGVDQRSPNRPPATLPQAVPATLAADRPSSTDHAKSQPVQDAPVTDGASVEAATSQILETINRRGYLQADYYNVGDQVGTATAKRSEKRGSRDEAEQDVVKETAAAEGRGADDDHEEEVFWAEVEAEGELAQTIKRVQAANKEQLRLTQQQLEAGLQETILGWGQNWIDNSQRMVTKNAKNMLEGLESFDKKNKDLIGQRTEKKKRLELERNRLNDELQGIEQQRQQLVELKRPLEAQLEAQKQLEQEKKRQQQQERRYLQSQRRAVAALKEKAQQIGSAQDQSAELQQPIDATGPSGAAGPGHPKSSELAGLMNELQGLKENQYSQHSMITVKNEDIALRRPAFDMRNDIDESRFFRHADGIVSPVESSVVPDRGDGSEQANAHNASQIDLKSRSTRGRNSPDRGAPPIGAPGHPSNIEKRINEDSLQTPAAGRLHQGSQRANFTTFNQEQDDAEAGHANAMVPDWSASAGLLGSVSDMGARHQQVHDGQEQLGPLEDSVLGAGKLHQSQSIAAPTATNFGNLGHLGIQHKKEATLIVHPQLSGRRLLDEAGTELSDVQEADLYQQPYDSEVLPDQSEDGDGLHGGEEENVDLDEADELNSDKGSAAARMVSQAMGSAYLIEANRQKHGRAPHEQQKQIMDVNTGKFNELMNQIIGEFAENDAEDHDPQLQANSPELPTQTPNVEHSKAKHSGNPSSSAQSTKILPPNLSSLSHQYMSGPTKASQQTGTNLTLSATDPIIEAISHLKKESLMPTTQSQADSSSPGSAFSLPHPSKSILEHKLNQLHLDFVYVSARIAETKQALSRVEEQIAELEEAIHFLMEQAELIQTFKKMSEQQKTSFWKGLEALDEFLKKSVDDTMKANHVNIAKVEASMQSLNSIDQMLKLKSTSWEEEIRNLQDKCQQRQFQVDHLKREMAELMLEQTDPLKSATTNRALIEKQHQQQQEAAQRNFQTLLQNETFQSLGILQRQISKLYNKLLEYNNKRNQALQDKLIKLNAGDGPSNFEEKNNVLFQDDGENAAASQMGSKIKQKIRQNALKSTRSDLPELDFIEVLPNAAAGGALNVTQENFNLTRQNMKRKTIQIDQAAQILSDICNENRRLSEVIETVSAMSLRNYFELSRILRSELSKEEHDELLLEERQKDIKKMITKKIQDSIQELRAIQMRGVSQSRGDYCTDGVDSQKGSEMEERSNITGAASNVSVYCQSHQVPFSFKYIHRFNEMINEARAMFVTDLSTLQHEMATSRKLLIQVHRNAENQKKENQMLVAAHAQISNKLTSLQESYEEANKKKEKTNLQLSKLEGESQSYLLQIEKLELITNNKDKQILKMMEEIKSYQAQISKIEQMVFEHQTEIQRKKTQIAEQQQSLAEGQEEQQEQKDQIETLRKEIKNLKGQVQNKTEDGLLRDVSNWMTDCITYNDNFLENQELINQLQMTIDEPHGSLSWEEEDQSERIVFDAVSVEEVARIVRKINQQSVKFEPIRSRLKQNIYMIKKRINEYRQQAQNMRMDNQRVLMNQTKQSSEPLAGSQDYKSGRSQLTDNPMKSPSPSKRARQAEADKGRSRLARTKKSFNRTNNNPSSLDEALEHDVFSTFDKPYPARATDQEDHDDGEGYADDEIRLRLDVCQEEKYELQRKLKQQNVKVQKLDEYRMKFESLNEAFKQLRSRFSILVDKLKKLPEKHPDTTLAEEIGKLLRKMSTLPQIQQLNISYLSARDSSQQRNRKNGYQASKFKSQVDAGLNTSSNLGSGSQNRGIAKSNRLKSVGTDSPAKSQYQGEDDNFLITSESDGDRAENERNLKDGPHKQRMGNREPNSKTRQHTSKDLADASQSKELRKRQRALEGRQEGAAGLKISQKETNSHGSKEQRRRGNGNLNLPGSEYQTFIEDNLWPKRRDQHRSQGSGEKKPRKEGSKETARGAGNDDDLSAENFARHWSFGANAEEQIALALQMQKEAVKMSAKGTQTEISTAEASCQTEDELVSEQVQRLAAKTISPDDLSMFIQNQNQLISSLKNLDKVSNSESDINQDNSLANQALPSQERTAILNQTQRLEGKVGGERIDENHAGSSHFQSQGVARGASLVTTPADGRERRNQDQRSSFNSSTMQKDTEFHVQEGAEIRRGHLTMTSQGTKLIPSPASNAPKDSQKSQQPFNENQLPETDRRQNMDHHPGNEAVNDPQINAVEITIPDGDRSRTSIQILDQALPVAHAQAQPDPALHSQPDLHSHPVQAQDLHNTEALLAADRQMLHYEDQFDEIQRELNALQDKRKESTVVVDPQRLRQELAMKHTEYSDPVFNEHTDWTHESRHDASRGGPQTKQQDMLIIEDSRDQEQIEEEMLGPGGSRHASRGPAHQQASGGEAYEERPEDQYDFSEREYAQTPQHKVDSTGSGNLPEDREHFFQIDDTEEAAQGGDEFQLDESDFMDPYGNSPDEHGGNNQQVSQNQSNRFAAGQSVLYQQQLPETIQEELEGEGESNFGSRDFGNMNISKVSRISKASQGPSQPPTASNRSLNPSAGVLNGAENGRPAVSTTSKSSSGSNAAGAQSAKRVRRTKYSNNSKYLSRNARNKNQEESQKSENDVEMTSSAVLSQNQDGQQETMTALHSQTGSISNPAEPHAKALSARSSHGGTPAMIMMQQAIQQESQHQLEGSMGSHLGSTKIHHVSPHNLSMKSGPLSSSQRLPDHHLPDKAHFGAFDAGRRSLGTHSGGVPQPELTQRHGPAHANLSTDKEHIETRTHSRPSADEDRTSSEQPVIVSATQSQGHGLAFRGRRSPQ